VLSSSPSSLALIRLGGESKRLWWRWDNREGRLASRVGSLVQPLLVLKSNRNQVNTVIPCGEIPDRRGGRLRHGAAGHYRHGHGAGFSIHRLERPIPLSIFRKCFLRSPGRG